MEMTKVDNYDLPPGCCTFCRSNALPAVDTHLTDDDMFMQLVEMEHQGAIYICVNCANDIMALFGAIPPEQAARQREEVASLQHEVAALTQERDALDEAVQALRRIPTRSEQQETEPANV